MINQNAFEKLYGFDISVEPNPAKEWAAFNYTLPDSETEGIIKISDVSGKLITTLTVTGKQGQKVWDTAPSPHRSQISTLNSQISTLKSQLSTLNSHNLPLSRHLPNLR